MIQVYVPDYGAKLQEIQDNPKLRFVLSAKLPKGAQFLETTSIPNVIDILGFSSGGMMPGFVYEVDPQEEETEDAFFMLIKTGEPVPLLKTLGAVFLGTVRMSGMLLAVTMMRSEAATDAELATSAICAAEAEGLLIVPLKIYETPPIVSTMATLMSNLAAKTKE